MIINKTMIESINEILNFRYNKEKFQKFIKGNTEVIKCFDQSPAVFNHFRFVISQQSVSPEINSNALSNDVLCHPDCIDKLDDILKTHNIERLDNLVCAGGDRKLSESLADLASFKHLFKHIYYEAKDIPCSWVTSIPMGVNVAYILRCGENAALHYINKQKQQKSKLIAAAFGSKWPVLNVTIKDRRELIKYIETANVIDDVFCNPVKYFSEISQYKFFACPIGRGIQTPKICEAILCETVPVVTDHILHKEFRDIYKLPILIVKDWSEVTTDFLNYVYESRFKYVNWQVEKSKFLAKSFEFFIQQNS